MQMTAVYACVRILSEAIAGLPLHVYHYEEDGRRSKALSHPLYVLLHDEPNPEMTSFVFRETLMTHLLLWGNAYAQVIRNGRGDVVGLYPLMPNRMQVGRNDNGELEYVYTRTGDEPNVDAPRKVTLTAADVLHIPGLGFDGLVGYSPIAMAKNAIGLAIATEEYGASFLLMARPLAACSSILARSKIQPVSPGSRPSVELGTAIRLRCLRRA
ncbi:phage portal protein [Arcanobacterium hippocoleae]